jgi:hypothetical protein
MFSGQNTHVRERLLMLRYCSPEASQLNYGYLWGYLRGLASEDRISWAEYDRLMVLVDNAYGQTDGRAWG